MTLAITTRHIGKVASIAPFVLAAGVCLGAVSGTAAGQETQAPAPIERRPPPAASATSVGQTTNPQRPGSGKLPRGEHLAQWMNQHSNLSPEQQQQALGQEPGFSNLPSDTQQRYRDRLAQLDALNPAQRQRFLAHTEAMERLSPDQRAEVRGAMGRLGALPVEQRRVVAHTFRSLRDLPPEQRIPALNSGRYGPPLDPQQRDVLLGLLQIEPMLERPAPRQPVSGSPSAPSMQMAPGVPGQNQAPR